MGKSGGGKGGKGRVGKIIGIAAGIAFGFGGGAWAFLKGVSVFSRVMYGLSLGMSIGGLFDKQKNTTPESTFDSKNNQVTSEGTIPIIYGQSKAGGLQTYHHMDVDGRKLLKHVIIGEGEIDGFFGVTANGYLLPIKTGDTVNTKVKIFGIRNNKWRDATVQVSAGTAPPRGFKGLIPRLNMNSQQSIYQDDIDYKDFNKFPKLVLHANGKETYIFLTDDNTKIDDKYSLACNTFGKVYQIILGDTYLSDLQKDGWELVDPVICQDAPKNIQTTEVMPCYKRDIFFTTNGDQDAKKSTVVLHEGQSDAEAPSTYTATGGYPNTAYMVADLRYTDKMGAGNPTVTAIVRGRKVYDWRTGKTEYSKNPAVCLYDYLTNDVYGAGKYITPDILDMESFTDVANYCDEVITYNDPYGVTKSEKRYELDIILNETKSHLENTQSILNSFLGFIVFSNNKIKLRCERLETPVYAFNDDNIVENSLSYKGASIDQSPNKFNLTYVEPALDYTAVKLIVEDATNQLPPPIGIGRPVEQDIEFKGVRRQTQCLRLGKIARDIIRLCPITVTFKTGLMASHLEAGDVVTISKTFIDENGEEQWLFENQQVRIVEIKEEDGTYEISGKQYNPSIYDDTFGASLKVFAPTGDNSKEINLLPETVKPVENISVEQVYRQRVNGVPTYDAILNFTEPEDVNYWYAQVSVQIERNGVLGDWKVYGATHGIMPVIGLQRNDKVHFRIIPYDSKDLPHEESIVTYAHTIVPKIGNPSAPTDVNIRFTDMATISWKRVTTADIDRYEVRSSESLTTDNLLLMTSEISGEIDLTRIGRSGTVWVYAVNSEEVYSSPTKYGYNVPKPSAPTVTTKAFMQSFRVTYGDIPKGCTAVVRIDNKDYRTKDTLFVYNETSGLFNVSVAFEDYFGLGDFSQKQMVEIVATIPQELLDKEALGINAINKRLEGIDKTTVNLDKKIDVKAGEITQTAKDYADTKVKALDGTVQSQITQFSNAIQSKVSSLEKVNDVTSSYARAMLAISHAPQLMRDPVFKSELELDLYTKDGQQITQQFGSANATYDDVVTGGRMVGLLIGNNIYSSIGYGGFKLKPKQQSLSGKLNGTYIVRMVAKVKPSMTIHLNNNDIGNGGTSGWLTDNTGTDKPEEYVFYWKYGKSWSGNDANNRECGYVYFKDKSGRSVNPNFIAWIYKIEAYAIDEYDDSLATVQSSITQLSNSIDAKVQNLQTGLSTRITQLDNAIKSQVLSGDKVMSAITQYTGGTRIDGKLLHVTGQTKFDDNIVTDKMLKANSVTADKIKADSLSAINANLGNVHSGTITSSTIRNENGTFSVDPNGNIRGANITGSTISADSIINAGFKVKNIDFAVLTVAHGRDIPAIGNYDIRECTFVPLGYYFTEIHSHDWSTRDGRERWRKAEDRKQDRCTIYLQGNMPQMNNSGRNGDRNLKTLVGLNGRTAVCQATWESYWSSGGDNGNDRTNEFISYGVIYVLVIGKKG